MGHNGHTFITEELVQYYVDGNFENKKFPIIDPPKEPENKKELKTIEDFF